MTVESEGMRVEVPVWDPAVRLFHWTIVVLLIVSITTGKLGGEWLVWHMRSGQTILVLLLFRVLWGFAGSGNARFAAFLRGPAAALRYARRHHVGAGGLDAQPYDFQRKQDRRQRAGPG